MFRRFRSTASRSKGIFPDFNQAPIRSDQNTVCRESKRSDVLRRKTLLQLLPAVLSIIVNLNTSIESPSVETGAIDCHRIGVHFKPSYRLAVVRPLPIAFHTLNASTVSPNKQLRPKHSQRIDPIGS